MGQEAEEREAGDPEQGKAEATTTKKRPSETRYTATIHTTKVPAMEGYLRVAP